MPNAPTPTRAVTSRIAVVLAGWCFYAGLLGWQAVAADRPASPIERAALADGRRAWRRGGCGGCHALYGLGGHSGPDLTNVARRSTSGEIMARIHSGGVRMPATAMSTADARAISGFLIAVAATGTYPPASLSAPGLGGSR